MNNSQEIILAQIRAIYDKPPFVLNHTGIIGDFKMILSHIEFLLV